MKNNYLIIKNMLFITIITIIWWVYVTSNVQSILRPDMTQLEIVQSIPNSVILNFKDFTNVAISKKITVN